MATIASDNRYARVKYGQTKWGASAPAASTILAWEVLVDWNGDTLLTDGNESNRLVSISGFRGRRNMLKPLGSGFEQQQIGQFIVTLDNYDGRYDAWNAASPLYPNVIYGRDVRIRVKDLSTANIYPVFYGLIADIVPVGNGTLNPQVQLIVQDAWSYLRNNKARVAIQRNITTDAAISKVLNAVNWRWGRQLDVSPDTIGYWWAGGTQDAGAAIEDLSNSGAGSFFIDASGTARYLIRSDIPAATISLDQSILLKDISISQPWDNFRNIMRMTVNPRTLANSGVVWKLSGNSPLVQPGAANALTFTANYTYNNAPSPAINVLQPVAGTDWKATQNADGTGTDYTANCTLAIVDNGDNALCTFTNNSGVAVYLYQPQIIGQAIYVLNTVDATYPANPSTIQNPREFVQNLPWQQDINVALTIAGVLGPFYSGKYPTITARIAGRPSVQFNIDLFDTVSVTSAKLGLNGQSFRVGGIEISSNGDGCQNILTTLYLEPYTNVSSTGAWDTAVWDTPVWGW